MNESPEDRPRPAGFPRGSRLKRRTLIRALFDRNRTDVGSIAGGSIRIVYRIVDRAEAGPGGALRTGFAPGRSARRAVQRNRIKRVLREVYRLHQGVLVGLFWQKEVVLTQMILYRGDLLQAPAAIRNDLPGLLDRLARRLERDERLRKSSVSTEQP